MQQHASVKAEQMQKDVEYVALHVQVYLYIRIAWVWHDHGCPGTAQIAVSAITCKGCLTQPP